MPEWWGRLRAALRFETIAPEPISQVPGRALLGALDGLMSSTGVPVSLQATLGLPEVEACHRVIAQGVARCPLKVRVQRAGQRWEDAEAHSLWELLHDLPNPEQTASAFRSQMTRDLLAYERAFAQIVRRGDGTPIALWRLDPMRMALDRDGLNRKRYTYTLASGERQVWTFDADKPPLLDLEWQSPVHRCKELFGLALAVEQYAGLFFSNGARLSGLLSTDLPKIPDESLLQLKAQFAAMNTGLTNAHKVAVVTGGMKFTPLTASNDEAQLLDLRKFLRQQICGVFGVPPHKVADLERATFSNIEHQDREFVSNTLDPMFVLWEQSLRRDVLSTRQYPNYRVVFDREALIQSDMKSRIEALALGRQNGVFSANDVRRKLEENPIPQALGGDLYHMNGAMVPLTGAPAPAPSQAPAQDSSQPEVDESDSPEQVM